MANKDKYKKRRMDVCALVHFTGGGALGQALNMRHRSPAPMEPPTVVPVKQNPGDATQNIESII